MISSFADDAWCKPGSLLHAPLAEVVRLGFGKRLAWVLPIKRF